MRLSRRSIGTLSRVFAIHENVGVMLRANIVRRISFYNAWRGGVKRNSRRCIGFPIQNSGPNHPAGDRLMVLNAHVEDMVPGLRVQGVLRDSPEQLSFRAAQRGSH